MPIRLRVGPDGTKTRRWSWHRIRVISPRIRLGTCSKCSIVVPSTTQRALSNGLLIFFRKTCSPSKSCQNPHPLLKSAFDSFIGGAKRTNGGPIRSNHDPKNRKSRTPWKFKKILEIHEIIRNSWKCKKNLSNQEIRGNSRKSNKIRKIEKIKES
jgi:hypothetical protein